MVSSALITFYRNAYDDGFAFACMKTAYKLGIRGRMDYSPERGFIIHAEGENHSLSEFSTWINENAGAIRNLNYQPYPNFPITYKEFDIYRRST